MSDKRQPTMDELRARMPSKGGKLRGLYAAPPGTGPVGRTCKTCAFRTSTGGKKSHPKCGKVFYTHGDATTIIVATPACREYADEQDVTACRYCMGRSVNPALMVECVRCNNTGREVSRLATMETERKA